jgi:hypothetical protein
MFGVDGWMYPDWVLERTENTEWRKQRDAPEGTWNDAVIDDWCIL